MGEHSPCDALVPSIVADYAVTQSIIPESFSSPEPPPFCSGRDIDATGWERLDWVTDTCIEAECIAAESRAKALIADSDDGVLWFSDYGTDWIKSIGTSGFRHHPPLTVIDLLLNEYSWHGPRRVRANGASIGLVQDTREFHGHVRDRPHAILRQGSHGDNPYSDRGLPRVGLVDDR